MLYQQIDQDLELQRACPLIPEEVVVHGYVWEVERSRLRRPYERLSEKVNTAHAMRAPG